MSDERDCVDSNFASIISMSDDALGAEVAKLFGGHPYRDDEGMANANLIAAAPDLLAACEAMFLWTALAASHPAVNPQAAMNALADARAALAALRKAGGGDKIREEGLNEIETTVRAAFKAAGLTPTPKG